LLKKEFIYLQLNRQLSVSYFVKGESFMFKKYITILLFLSFLMISSDIFGQRPCPPGQRPNPGGDPPCIVVGPPTPIDNGLILLFAAGLVLGIKKLRDHITLSE
jgi:hypothetical protein